MNRIGKRHLFVGLGVTIFFLLAGCATKQDSQGLSGINPKDVVRFEAQIDALVDEIVATQYGTLGEFAPVAVIPGAIKYGVPYTHLEEVIADTLKNKLQHSNELYVFTSQNWFEYREGRPLSFSKSAPREGDLLRQMKIFEVRLNLEPLFAKADVEIVVSNADGHILQGQRAQQNIDFGPASPAARLNAEPVNRTPFPEGIEERPYTSIDRFAFSLVADLIDTYKAGVLSSGRHASKEDVQVVLSVTPTTLVPRRTKDSIAKALQHAIIRAKGVTCVLSPRDQGVDESKVQQGTVLLVIDLDRVAKSDVITVAMRGVWQVSPLETASGRIVHEDLAGTYLSGFTAKAYLQLKGQVTTADGRQVGTVDGQDVTVCFYGADARLLGTSYKALRHIPGAKKLARSECLDDHCGCWTMSYEKSTAVLSGWLDRYLPHYTDENGYTVRFQGPESIDVLYNGAGR